MILSPWYSALWTLQATVSLPLGGTSSRLALPLARGIHVATHGPRSFVSRMFQHSTADSSSDTPSPRREIRRIPRSCNILATLADDSVSQALFELWTI
ncbi:hypothetical protein B0H12DRAFT_1089012 [Mycena haematopus]|nr:hypothetical protein B0H12DRAFT_1089012 [Mycena haematopus]